MVTRESFTALFTQFTTTSRPALLTHVLFGFTACTTFQVFHKCWSQTADWPGSSRTLQTPVQAMMVIFQNFTAFSFGLFSPYLENDHKCKPVEVVMVLKMLCPSEFKAKRNCSEPSHGTDDQDWHLTHPYLHTYIHTYIHTYMIYLIKQVTDQLARR